MTAPTQAEAETHPEDLVKTQRSRDAASARYRLRLLVCEEASAEGSIVAHTLTGSLHAVLADAVVQCCHLLP